MSKKNNSFQAAVETVAALRGENGCPWDKVQSHQSLRRYLLEETYEVLESLDRFQPENPKSVQELRDELGDLLFQVLLHSQLAEEKSLFSIDDVAEGLAEKLKRRHPHVFGDKKLNTTAEISENWEQTKNQEKKKERVLEGIPPALPALQRATKVIEKVSRVGFQWENIVGPIDKMMEELQELKEEIAKLGPPASVKPENQFPEAQLKAIQSELGDLLFCVANIGHFLNINAEDSLREMLLRFEKRFNHVEDRVKEQGKSWKECTLAEMDRYWDESKKK